MRFIGWNFLEVDELADTTDASPVGQWVKGVGLAGLVAAYAVDCLVTQHAIFPARYRGFAVYDGLGGTALGLVYLSIALFLHLHCFWSAQSAILGICPARQDDRGGRRHRRNGALLFTRRCDGHTRPSQKNRPAASMPWLSTGFR